MAALTRNQELGKYVSVVKNPINTDIYEWFANKLKTRLKESVKNPLREFFITLFESKIDLRRFVKMPIMTYPYGLTLFGLTKQIWSHFKALNIKLGKEEIRYIRDLLDSTRTSCFESVLHVRNLLSSIVKDCNIVSWTLPDGFIVHQHYNKTEEIDIHTTLNGIKMETRVLYVSKIVSSRRHQQAITPNFIHSYDAYHMREIIRGLNEYKIPVFPIHDTVGWMCGPLS